MDSETEDVLFSSEHFIQEQDGRIGQDAAYRLTDKATGKSIRTGHHIDTHSPQSSGCIEPVQELLVKQRKLVLEDVYSLSVIQDLVEAALEMENPIYIY